MQFIMNLTRPKQVLLSIAAIVLIFISFFPLANYSSSPLFGKNLQQSLDNKNKQAMLLFSSATAASIAVSLLPGDIGDAISKKLSDAAGFFLLVTGAITLEKIMISLSGLLCFKIIIPISFLILIFYLWTKRSFLFALFCKFFISGIIFIAAVPSSLYVSNLVESKFLYRGENDEKIESALTIINNDTAEIGIAKESISGDKEARKWWDIPGKITDVVRDVTSWIGRQARLALEKAEDALKTLLTALLNMTIIVCVVPLITIIGFAMLFKILWKADNKKFTATLESTRA